MGFLSLCRFFCASDKYMSNSFEGTTQDRRQIYSAPTSPPPSESLPTNSTLSQDPPLYTAKHCSDSPSPQQFPIQSESQPSMPEAGPSPIPAHDKDFTKPSAFNHSQQPAQSGRSLGHSPHVLLAPTQPNRRRSNVVVLSDMNNNNVNSFNTNGSHFGNKFGHACNGSNNSNNVDSFNFNTNGSNIQASDWMWDGFPFPPSMQPFPGQPHPFRTSGGKFKQRSVKRRTPHAKGYSSWSTSAAGPSKPYEAAAASKKPSESVPKCKGPKITKIVNGNTTIREFKKCLEGCTACAVYQTKWESDSELDGSDPDDPSFITGTTIMNNSFNGNVNSFCY